MTESYPVRLERRLTPVPRRFWGSAHRALTELPDPEPGTVLVFEVGGRYEAFLDRKHLRGNEEIVVAAVAVSLVDMRSRAIPVDLWIPSASPANDFLIQVLFHCQVLQPELVAAAGLTGIGAVLRTHLAQDRKLHDLGLGLSVDDLNDMRMAAHARITSFLTVRPPTVAGMRVELAEVGVVPPDDLRQHAQRVQHITWDQSAERLIEQAEAAKAQRLKALIEGSPEAAEALALARGDRNAAQVADRMLDDRQAQEQRELAKLDHFRELINVAAERGVLDRVPIDGKALFDHYVQGLTGRDLSVPVQGPGIEAARNQPARLTAREDTRPPQLPDDDDDREDDRA